MDKKDITATGYDFIKYVVKKGGEDLLEGKNGSLPMSDDGSGNLVNQTWKVEAESFDSTTSNPKALTKSNLAESLKYWFNKYAEIYGLDANILAAQAYIESKYVMWYYPDKTTASGVNQFKMLDVYSVIVNNFGAGGPPMSPNEIVKIVGGLTQEIAVSSYLPDEGTPATRTISKTNRPILHQNIINNPEIMIKAQARYMRYFADNCGKLASTSLFCFKAGTEYVSDTYSRAIDKLLKANDNDPTATDVKAALDYVLMVFGVLGDENNKILNGGLKNYKPNEQYFGYDKLFSHPPDGGVKDADLVHYPNDKKNPDTGKQIGNFDSFAANITEADEYGIVASQLDNLSIARDDRYKFIYFPSDQYFQGQSTDKLQIVLHHTVSGDKGGVGGDVKWWRDKGERVATAFIVARNGDIYQLFNTDYWAHHLGITSDFIKAQGTTKSNKYLNKQSIGIEIDSWGGLKQASDGKWYPTIMFSKNNLQSQEIREGAAPITDVTLYNKETNYPQGFRGFYGFETYTTAQLDATRDLILSLVFQSINKESTTKEGKYPEIPLPYNEDIWDVDYETDRITTSSPDGAPNISKNAMNGVKGVWTHTSYRADKSDCHPQKQLIEMLRGLEAYRSPLLNS